MLHFEDSLVEIFHLNAMIQMVTCLVTIYFYHIDQKITCLAESSFSLELNYLYYWDSSCSRYSNLFTVELKVIYFIRLEVIFIYYNYWRRGSCWSNYGYSFVYEVVLLTITTFIYWLVDIISF